MSKIKVNSIEAATGTTITIPSGQTLDVSSATVTLPATLPASSGANLTNLNASNLSSGTVASARLNLTTQGDIVYRDGSGLQRLGAGTSGQALLTQGTGANPIWGDAGGGVLQTVFTTTSTTFASSSDSYVATPLTITITPTSSSSKIVLFMRTHINVTGDSYPRFKWYRSIGGGSFTSIITEPTNPNGGASLGTYLGDRANATNVHQMNVMSDVYQDFPNTTSAVTYTLYGVRENGGTFYINTSEYQEAGNTQDFNQVGISTILAMETGV
jgi:hypothetical protein